MLTVYTGELSGDCNPPTQYGYCYDGHDGIDFALPQGTPVLAAADGRVLVAAFLGQDSWGNAVFIDHGNGYSTLYAHLLTYSVGPNQMVTAGTIIGYSGSTGNSSGPHLHFGVYFGNQIIDDAQHVTDPYGWQGDTTDPLRQTYGAPTAKCLWRSLDLDPITCADVIAEDGQVGSGMSNGWNLTTAGNSYQLHYHLNDNQGSGTAYAIWGLPKVHGLCRIYVWVPANYATTQSLTYWIGSYLYGWRGTANVNQNFFANRWVLMWTGQFNGSDYPLVYILGTNTGETVNTKWIAADAMKFRCYNVYLPIVRKN
jgi:murein DD-endopeptidase MepM/ murein hydrolase activator NlpD